MLIWLHGDGGNGSASGAEVLAVHRSGRRDRRDAERHRPDLEPPCRGRPGPLDSQFLERLIDLLIGCESVDPNRIFVGGTSRGAFMPYYLLQRAGTRDKIAAVAVNAGLLYCQDGDTCAAETSDPVLPRRGRTDPPPARHQRPGCGPAADRALPRPVDWDVDWRVFNPMKLWAQQHGCWTDQIGGPNNGVLRETYQVGGRAARVYDLTGHGAACADYQLILVTSGGHVIDGQEGRIWAFLMDRPFVVATECKGQAATVMGHGRPGRPRRAPAVPT